MRLLHVGPVVSPAYRRPQVGTSRSYLAPSMLDSTHLHPTFPRARGPFQQPVATAMNDNDSRPTGLKAIGNSLLFRSLAYADIRVLWLATSSHQLGQGMQQVLLGWLVFEMTGSGGILGAVYAARSAPNLLVGLAAGSIADRVDRRTMLRASVWGSGAVTLVLALLLATDLLVVWHLVVLAVFLGTMQAFYTIARQVYVYDVVGASGAVNGIAMINLAQRVGQVMGSLAAGSLIAWQGPAFSSLFMGISYVCGALLLYGLRQPGDSAPPTREPLKENLVNYFRALKNNRVMLSLMISTAAAEVLGFSHQVMLPILAKEILLVGPVGLGVLSAFRFAGGAVGVVILTLLGELRHKGTILLVALCLFGVGQILLGQSPNFLMALLFVTLINSMAAVTDVLHQSLLQLSVSNEQRGRAMGSWIIGIGTAPVGQLEVGYLAELSNARIALLVNGLALATLALVMAVIMPRLRRL